MKTLKDIDIEGKRVLVRVDFNVPLDKDGNITDDTRIRGVLPTLSYLLEKKSVLIIASHLGRPKGNAVPEFSLSPVAGRLSKLLGKEVKMASDCVGPDVKKSVSEIEPGDVILLENLRFHSEEQENDDLFAKELASLCDVFINDAFAVSHRVNASVGAITKYVSEAGAGFLLKRELDYFKNAMTDPKRPLIAIVGGAKVSTKLAAVNNMIQHVNKLIIGGAMANTFIKSAGFEVGKSMIESGRVEEAASIMKKAAEEGVKLYTPVDVAVANKIGPDEKIRYVPVQEIPENKMALDIGPASTVLFDEVLYDAGTIVWNGPMGVFETEPFSHGTINMVKSVANSDALSIIGGGDTNAAVHMAGESDRISFISTGGGAFLTLLEGKTLPGVAALDATG